MVKLAQYKEKLLDEFESRNDEWTFSDFEARLKGYKSGSSYHDAKGVIIDGHAIGKWPNAIKRYLFTNYKTFGNVSSEFTSIFNEVYASLNPTEKQDWDLGIK